jgi:GNAT superfamily N-acetyltransferase
LSDIRHLEEASLAGLPALRTDHYDGWLLRFADGYSRRANSVAPLFASTIDLDEKIRYCESAYARAGLPCIFKLTEASTPDGLDEALSSRGYRRDAETLVCTHTIGADEASAERVKLFDTPEGDWLETRIRIDDGAVDGEILGRLLAATPTPAVYVLIRDPGGVGVACARATLSGGVVGLYDLQVAPGHRRRGLATDLTRSRLWWASTQGASRAFLQVMENNPGAQALQTRLGFAEAYRYWYRLQP